MHCLMVSFSFLSSCVWFCEPVRSCLALDSSSLLACRSLWSFLICASRSEMVEFRVAIVDLADFRSLLLVKYSAVITPAASRNSAVSVARIGVAIPRLGAGAGASGYPPLTGIGIPEIGGPDIGGPDMGGPDIGGAPEIGGIAVVGCMTGWAP